MKIAIYARVSSETQAKEGTIESQIEALREYAKKHNLDVIHECLDDGYSGMTLDRPGLDQVRDLAQTGEIEGVLILAPDRLSRKQANQIILMEEFKKRNIQVIFTTQNFENNPEGNLMLQIQGAVAEYEREKILDRMRRGAIYAAKKGQVNGGNAPYGYRYIPKNKDNAGYLEINPSEAKIVKYIYELYIKYRLKGTQIAKRLNDEHLPSRNNFWWAAQIYNILKSETYSGTTYAFKNKAVEPKRSPKTNGHRKKKNISKTIRPREDWIGIAVPPIIDKTTWNKAQELLKENAYRARRNNTKNQYLLRGLVLCGLCGSIASGYVSNKSTYYSCGAKRRKNRFSKPHDELIQVSHKPFDEKVWKGLTELLSNPKNLKAQLEKRLVMKTETLSPEQSDDEINKEIEKLAIQEKRILDAYREEIINLEELKVQKEQIANRRIILQSKKKPVPSPVERSGRSKITLDMLGDVSNRFQRAMAKASFDKQEMVVNRLVKSVVLMTDKAIVKGIIPIDTLDVLVSPRTKAAFLLCDITIPSKKHPSKIPG